MINQLLVCVLLTTLMVTYDAKLIVETRENAMEDKYFQGDMKGIEYSEKDGKLTTENEDLEGTWEHGAVPYKFESDYTQSEIDLMKLAMKTIEDQTRKNGKDCIKFVPRGSEKPYFKFVNKHGCYSYVGRQDPGFFSNSQDISIKRGACMYKGVIMHELVHLLGLHHEHTRWDRDLYIRVNLNNVDSGNKIHFTKYKNQPSSSLPYDINSIMQIDSTAFAKDGVSTTITSKQNAKILPMTQKTSLTRTDVEKIRLLYKCQ